MFARLIIDGLLNYKVSKFLIFLATFLSIMFFVNEVISFIQEKQDIVSVVASSVPMLVFFIAASLAYASWPEGRAKVEGAGSVASMERSISAEMETLRRDLLARLEPLEKAVDASSEEISAIAERVVSEKVSEEFGEDLVATLGDRMAEQMADHARKLRLKQNIVTAFDISSIRIKAHAESAETAARFYRKMGVLLALLGIIVAGGSMIVFYYGALMDTLASVLNGSRLLGRPGIAATGGGAQDSAPYVHYLKHLPFTMPFIILTEVLALIMFRYQSKSLEMMRYFSNEVSTLNLRRAGALATAEFGTPEAIADLAAHLLKAERNIVIRKDERTLEMAHNHNEDTFIQALVDKLDARWRSNKQASDA